MTDLPTGTVTFLLTDVEGSTRLWEEQPKAMAKALASHDTTIERCVEGHGGVLRKSRGEGDSAFAVFSKPTDAVRAVLEIQRTLAAVDGPSGPLTTRESEVAQLLSSGLTNRRIAERIVVSVRTVDAHVEHIRNKLGLRTRAEIATWVSEKRAYDSTPELRVRCALHTGEAEFRDGDYYGSTVNRCARLRAIAYGGQVLLSRTTADLTRRALPDRATLRDLGSHRLRDLQESEHVFQLCHPDLSDDFPPLLSLDVLPTNLPTQVASFIGREEEISSVAKLLESNRLVTLTGSAGVGKTSLALRVAADLFDRYPDGVWLIELGPITDGAFVVQNVAAALGVREESPGGGVSQPLEDQLLHHLRPRKLLIVLDNCEHLATECARLTGALLRSSGDARMLATSREPLGVAGESIFRVPSLDHTEAVRLFVDRAQQGSSDFRLTNENAAAIARICAQLDGIPLAIELAAARVLLLTPNEIADRIGDRFKLLTGGARTALERHQTMRAALDWSYDHLVDAERLLLERLSVFVGGFTLEAAEAVCSDTSIASDDVLDLLGSLVRKSLVVSEERGDTTRYRLLEMIRQYSREKLVERGEATDLRAKHFAYFAEIAEPSRLPHVYRIEPGLLALMDTLETEHDNLRAALDWSEGTEEGLELATALAGFWFHGGHLKEGATRIGHALDPELECTNGARADALIAQGILLHESGQSEIARPLADEALAVWRSLDATPGIVRALELHHAIADVRGDVEVLRADGREAGRLAATTDDDRTRSVALWVSGWSAMHAGDGSRAKELFSEDLAICRARGFNSYISLWALGRLAQGSGDLEEAVDRLSEALNSAIKTRSALNIVLARYGVAEVAHVNGDFVKTRDELERAIDEARRWRVHGQLLLALGFLGQILTEEAKDVHALDRAEERLEEDVDLAPYALAIFRAMRAQLEGRFDDARHLAGEAASIGRLMMPALADSWNLLIDNALRRLHHGLDDGYVELIRATVELMPAQTGYRAGLGVALIESGRAEEARQQLEVLVRDGVIGLPLDQYRPNSLGLLALMCARLGDRERAGVIYQQLLPYSGRLLMVGGAACLGAADRFLGMLAATLDEPEEAERRFEAAIALEEALHARPLAACSRYEYARITTDHEKATMLLQDALATARELGMQNLEREALALT